VFFVGCPLFKMPGNLALQRIGSPRPGAGWREARHRRASRLGYLSDRFWFTPVSASSSMNVS